MATAAAIGPAALAGAAPEWTPSRLYTVAFLGVTSGVQMADGGMQAVLLGDIQRSFAVSDTTIGMLQGVAGFLVASLLAIPVGRLADRHSRRLVLACLIAAWTGLMVLSALAPTFPLFFIGRAASGIADFAMIPLVYSLIPDLAPERHRVAANLAFAAIMATGASAGFYFADAIAAAAQDLVPLPIAPWRRGFLLLAALGVPLLALAGLVTDPRAGGGGWQTVADATAGGESTLAGWLRGHWRPVALFAGMACCLILAVQSVALLIALALDRRFAPPPGVIGQAQGIFTLGGSLLCLPLAGLLDHLLRRRLGAGARPVVVLVTALLAMPAVLALMLAADWPLALVLVGVFLFATATGNALVPTMLQDLVPPPLRARGFAVWSCVISCFSAAAPLIAGILSDGIFAGQLLLAIGATTIPALILCATAAALLLRHLRTGGRAARLGPAPLKEP